MRGLPPQHRFSTREIRESNRRRLRSVFVATACQLLLAATLLADNPAFRFRDVGRETGLLPAASGIMGHGAGWGDADGDGWADLYIATFHYAGTRPSLFFRNLAGKFVLDQQPQLRVSTRGTGVLFVDLDNDGDLDLYLGGMPAPAGSRLANRVGRPLVGCALFRNEGGGKFANVSAESGACPPSFGGRSATTLDYDGDGLLDLLVGEDPLPGYNGSTTHRSRLFRNLGGWRFADVTSAAGMPRDAAGLGVAAADVNLDGWPDIFLASTLGNYLLLNNRRGGFREAPGSRKVFAWPQAKGDDMVCGVAISDVNADGLPDVVLGQHFSAPWRKGVPNRLYLNVGTQQGAPRFEDVTEQVGLVPLPLKSPHVEIQDFDNDGRVDIYASMVKFAGGRPYPVIFRNLGNRAGLPQFQECALGMNDFPSPEDRSISRSKTFFEKMVRERKVFYSAAGPSCDFDRDGRVDLFLASWWRELPSLLLRNETPSGNWIEITVQGKEGVNRMGIGARVSIYEAGRLGEAEALIGRREIATGFGYASSQEAVAHFGLGPRRQVDVEVILPHGRGLIRKAKQQANQRLTLSP